MVAGTNFGPPTFSNFWTPHPSILAQHNILLSSQGHPAGRGFFKRIPRGLPPSALSVLVRLATVDRYMAENSGRYKTDDAYRRMMSTRNSVHHAILSLAPWSQLDPTDQNATSEAVYECCRTSAVLYSSAVIYGLPHHLNWQAQPLAYLSVLVESSREELISESPELLLWALCIGALATSSSPARAFFDHELAELCEREDAMNRYSLSECQAIVEDFLWSPRACGDAGAIVWAALLS